MAVMPASFESKCCSAFDCFVSNVARKCACISVPRRSECIFLMEANKSLVPGKNNISSSGGYGNGKRKRGRSTKLRPEEGVDFISEGEPSSKENSAVSNGPIICPVWRGCFRTEKFGLLVDLVAHASKKSSFGIPTLDIDLVDLNIFPKNRRSETYFDNLINRLLNEGLAMKTMVDDNVLLVFTSHHLPYKYWRSEEANVLPVDT
ncbi:hypothetical protein COLO4_07071 [Corchorus olitorius]|uniref:AIPP2-like SPOC-like domain-containing protein n=1 Tax=Corchorus olitorius TaxID=93759 RepID=A0A1R3KL24_9ROSI|nr:hypothetical protein COLO4_07071 [Corchorus olitorius]